MSSKDHRRARSMPPRARPPRRHSTLSGSRGGMSKRTASTRTSPTRKIRPSPQLAFLDPPKAGASEALAALANLGVAVKVVTGDNEQVTRHVCGELGLNVAGTLTGPEVEGLTDEALIARLDNTTLFCRVTPPQKSRIITALRRKGHVVGYLGDGINDAPPLHAADVGFSVDTAVDVAKEAAAMILLRKDSGVLADGVRA